MSDNIFGPDRNDEPGITPQPGQLPPQVTDWMTESAAMHSKSQGWIPCVVVRIATEDGAGLVATLPVGEGLVEIIHNIQVAAIRADADVTAGIRDGTLP